LLRRSPEREAALQDFLEDAHRPGKASFHKWLRPEEFGKRFGPGDSEIGVVASWLQKHGFTVARVTKGKTAIEFSGTAGQVRDAFGTEIHAYAVRGDVHYANKSDPRIPAVLAPVISGISPLNDFQPKSNIRFQGQAIYDRNAHKMVPQWTFPAGQDLLDLSPGDFALQYDLDPLYTAGVNGTGVTIGIIGASNVDPAAVATYRSFFGLPPGQFNVVLDGGDPGLNGAAVESYLDVELSGAVAPNALITLYTSRGTTLQSGLYLAAQRAVDDDVATVLSTSYGLCEQDLGTSGNQFWANLWEQAAAQGQTPFVSSGDGGPDGCDDFNSVPVAERSIAVNGFASTPWNVAVGGTDFYYSSYNASASTLQSQLETYWNTVPTIFPTTSLLKPVPEQPWNDPFGLNIYNRGIYDPNQSAIVGGSGGTSSCSSGVEASDGTFSSCQGGYAKPAWQSGHGVAADGVRDLPDVSLFAAAGENDTAYPFCTSSLECVVQDSNLTIGIVGGTSASSPAMAGIMALINQKYGPQGQANYTMYPLAAQQPTAFHDVTVGSNLVPCQQGISTCTLSATNDNTNGYYTMGFYAAKGYDMATGLGSVDANLLVKYWSSLAFKPSATTLSLGATTFTHGAPIQVNVGVTGSGGTPSGFVSLVTNAIGQSNAGIGSLTLHSGTGSSTINNFPGGQYKVTARYGGDNFFADSLSSEVDVNVTAEDSVLSISGNTYNYNTRQLGPLSNGGSYAYGTYIAVDGQAQGVSAAPGVNDGFATGTVTFTDAATSGNTNSGPLTMDHSGAAEWVPTAGFAVGNHSLSASYSGDVSFNPSSSTVPLTFTITKVAPATNVYVGSVFNFRAQETIPLGSTTTLTGIVGITAVAARPTGTVTFKNGATVIGTGTLGPAPYYNPSVASATLNISTLPLGTNLISISYGGDNNYESVALSPSATIIVTQGAALTASANAPSMLATQDLTVTASVAQGSGQPAPTGSINFYAYGPGGSWSSYCYLVDSSCGFTFSGPYWSPGTVTVNVNYSGDANYAPGSTDVSVTMLNPFTMSAASAVSFGAGATTGNTAPLTITPASGFTGQVYFACTIAYYPPGAQQLPCSVPTSVNVTSASAVTSAMTIISTGPRTAARAEEIEPSRWLAAQSLVFAAGIFVIGLPLRKRIGIHRTALFLLIVLTAIMALVSCGGSSNGGGGGHVVPGTTPGTYKFMVDGAYTPNVGTSQPRFNSQPQVFIVNVTIK
jgi:subtilase family serine protease